MMSRPVHRWAMSCRFAVLPTRKLCHGDEGRAPGDRCRNTSQAYALPPTDIAAVNWAARQRQGMSHRPGLRTLLLGGALTRSIERRRRHTNLAWHNVGLTASWTVRFGLSP